MTTRSGRQIKKPVFYTPEEFCEDDYDEDADEDYEEEEEDDDDEEEDDEDEDEDEHGNLNDFIVYEEEDA